MFRNSPAVNAPPRAPEPDAAYADRLTGPHARLVFIMGCHRSGTSLLYHLLAYTGQVDYISAYDIIKYGELVHNRMTGREKEVKGALQALLQKEKNRGLDDLPVGADLPEEYRFLMPKEKPRALVLNVKKRVDDLTFKPHLTTATLDAFLGICRKKRFLAGDDRPLVLKNPADHYFNFLAVHRMLPEARFIFIHRHPLALLNSFSHGFPAILMERSNYAALLDERYRDLFSSPLRRYLFLKAFRSNTVSKLLAGRLVESFEYYLANITKLPESHFVSIGYEDLCADPIRSIGVIAARLKLDLAPKIPARFIAPRNLPVLPQVREQYVRRSSRMEAYRRHCGYGEWPAEEPAPAAGA